MQARNLNGKSRKNWGAKQNSGGAVAHPVPSLELPLLSKDQCVLDDCIVFHKEVFQTLY